jgi:hypothetical protein
VVVKKKSYRAPAVVVENMLKSCEKRPLSLSTISTLGLSTEKFRVGPLGKASAATPWILTTTYRCRKAAMASHARQESMDRLRDERMNLYVKYKECTSTYAREVRIAALSKELVESRN